MGELRLGRRYRQKESALQDDLWRSEGTHKGCLSADFWATLTHMIAGLLETWLFRPFLLKPESLLTHSGRDCTAMGVIARLFRALIQKTSLSFLRYSLMLLHLIIWIQMLVLSLLWTNMIAGPLIGFTGIALLTFIPATVILSAMNADTRFDHTAGELAYLAVQMVIQMLMVLISGLDYQSLNLCSGSGLFPSCPAMLAETILAVVHIGALVCWMAVLLLAADRHPLRWSQAFQLPAHRVVRRNQPTPPTPALAPDEEDKAAWAFQDYRTRLS